MPVSAEQALIDAYRQAKDTLIQLARLDINEFASYVLRDEVTHQPIEQGPTHREMQRLCDTHKRLILWSYTGAGKTQQIAVARTLFLLMRNPRRRIVIISNTKGMAAKIVRTVANYIEYSKEFREVAPGVRKGEPWTQAALYLQQEDGGFAKDPAVQGAGIHGNLTGSRADAMIWDDILDPETVKTQVARDDLHNWLKSAAVLGRVTPSDPIWVIGNAYHPQDSLHRFAEEGWAFERLPVIDQHGHSTWPERWPMDVIEAKRVELGALEFARQMLCRARDDSEARFRRDDLLACAARGRGLRWLKKAADLLGTPWPLPRGAVLHIPSPAPEEKGVGERMTRAGGTDAGASLPEFGPSVPGIPSSGSLSQVSGSDGNSGSTGAQDAHPSLGGPLRAGEPDRSSRLGLVQSAGLGSPRTPAQAGHPSSGGMVHAQTRQPGRTDEPHSSSGYTPPPLARRGGARAQTSAQAPPRPDQGPVSLADRQDELFPDARLLRSLARSIHTPPGAVPDPDAPAWLAARQAAELQDSPSTPPRGPRGGRSILHSRGKAAVPVLDPPQPTPTSPGSDLLHEPAGPGSPARDTVRERADDQTIRERVRAVTTGPRVDRNRAWEALAGHGHGSVTAAMYADELSWDEGREAMEVLRAADRLGVGPEALRDVGEHTHDEGTDPAAGATASAGEVTGAHPAGFGGLGGRNADAQGAGDEVVRDPTKEKMIVAGQVDTIAPSDGTGVHPAELAASHMLDLRRIGTRPHDEAHELPDARGPTREGVTVATGTETGVQLGGRRALANTTRAAWAPGITEAAPVSVSGIPGPQKSVLDFGAEGDASAQGRRGPQFSGGVGAQASRVYVGIGDQASKVYVPPRQRAPGTMRFGGLAFPQDAGPWLDEWTAKPGTPHRREDLYPVHPRSLIGLRRMGIEFHTGVDLAVQRHSAADYTVLYTLALYPPDPVTGRRTRRVCQIQRGKWYALDICRRILDVREAFGGYVLVENNAGQQYLIDILMQGGAGPVPDDIRTWLRGYTTGRNKASPEYGVPHLAAEFEREDWVWPMPDTWHPNAELPKIVDTNWNEILYFDPRAHTGDILMAQWLAKESARLVEIEHDRQRSRSVGVRVF